MSLLIIVEGCDATGKTTLIRNAINAWAAGAVYIHSTRVSPEETNRYLLHQYFRALQELVMGRTVFMDRWWPSDVIYSEVFKRAPMCPRVRQFMHEQFMSMQCGGYVICYDEDPMTTVIRHNEMSRIRPEMYSDIKDVAETYKLVAKGRKKLGDGHAMQCEWLKSIKPFEAEDPNNEFRQICESFPSLQVSLVNCIKQAIEPFESVADLAKP